MADKEKLVVKERSVKGKQVRSLRAAGETPVVMYGKDRGSIALSVDSHEFELLFKRAGGNTIIAVDMEKEDGSKEKKNALIHMVDRDPVNGKILHADLLLIKMNEKLTTNVPLRFVGDSIAVIDLQGSLLTDMDEIEVECLPADMPHEIEVDLSKLADFESVIHVSDIVMPENVVVLSDLEATVAKVEAPRSDEELEELEAAPEEPEAPESEHGSAEGTATEGSEETKE
jgi:large subunit ribosomal protein L25